MKKIAVTGGAPVRLAAATGIPTGIDWSNDDTILYSMFLNGVWSVSANGGTPELLIEDEVLSVRQKLPDGKTVLLGVGVDADEREVAVQSLTTGERKVLFQGSNAAYVPTGHIVFDGKILVYMVHTGGNLQANWDVWTLSVDDGAVESLYDLPDGVYLAPELSPDGRWMAYSSGDFAGQQDVYIEPFPQLTEQLAALSKMCDIASARLAMVGAFASELSVARPVEHFRWTSIGTLGC